MKRRHIVPTPEAAARGGRVKSPAKLAALAALHASRRGVPVHPVDPQVQAALKRVDTHLRRWNSPGSIRISPSMRQFALSIGYDPTTVARWISGFRVPPPEVSEDIMAWAESVVSQSRKMAAQKLNRRNGAQKG